MNSKITKFIITMMLAGLLMSACSALGGPGATAEPTALPPVASDVEIVAEGRLVPAETTKLAFFSAGQVEEIFVEKGDQVQAGQVVARLGNREPIEAQIAGAEAELLAAQKALENLNKPENIAVAREEALARIAAANKAVKDAQYQWDNFTVPTNQEDYTPMEGVKAMKELLDKARDRFEEVKYKSENDDVREARKDELDTAQSDYNSAVRRLTLETNLTSAQTQLDKAQKDLEALEEGPNPDDVANAEARVTAAEAALTSAKAALDDLELTAPINGTIVDMDLIVGQLVTAGQPIITLADFSQMYAETDDLTEIEVLDIEIGQEATVVADALPDVEMTGVVDSISQVYEEKRGDITYTTKILLNNVDPRLRWGMTVVITFKK
jgi:multidrug resistance efflux pump